MDIVIKIIGIVFVLIAIVYLLKPDLMKLMMGFFKKGKRLYWAAVIRFALAVVFLLAAWQCNIKWVIAAFGVLFIISGLLIFILGLEKIKEMLQWYENKPLLLLRIISLILLAMGVIIICSA